MRLPVLKKLVSDALAIATPKSGNTKTGAIAATYAPTDRTCVDCPLKESGCYHRTGYYTRPIDARLNDAAKEQKASIVRIATAEARAIDGLLTSGRVKNRPLRIHVGGDCPTDEAAEIVSAAARRFSERVEAPAYTYTHAWRRVERESWEGVSVLASIEDTRDGRAALARGYAPAVVVDKFDGEKAFERDGVTWIPCPSQTRDVSCVDCGLCMNADALHRRNAGIAFEAHGSATKKARAAIQAACAERPVGV